MESPHVSPPEETVWSDAESSGSESLVVDCATCVVRNTSACDDCMVTYICDRDPEQAVVITIDELRAMRTLSEGGLVPSLKHSVGA